MKVLVACAQCETEQSELPHIAQVPVGLGGICGSQDEQVQICFREGFDW